GNDLIAYGGATLDQALSRQGLVDEYRLMIQPAALGAGLPLFKDLAGPLHLELVEATTFATGGAIHVYRPGSNPAGQAVHGAPARPPRSTRPSTGSRGGLGRRTSSRATCHRGVRPL